MALALPAWIGDPIGWINTQLRMFVGLPARYDAMLAVARNVFTAEAQYRAQHGNYSTQSPRELAAIVAINELETAQRAWTAVRGKLVMGQQALGQVALIVVGVIGSIAVVVWAIVALIRKAPEQERFVYETLPNMPGATPEMALEAFRLQSEEQSAIEQLLGGTAKIIALAALAIGVYFLAPAVARRVR